MERGAARTAAEVDLEGRLFAAALSDPNGDVSPETVFAYHQQDQNVWAEYRGGAVVRGYLVGLRTADALDFRYVHLAASGETASGRCRSSIRLLADGRLALDERWSWESKVGSGSSTLEEQPIDPEFAYLTTTGRVSGQPHEIEIWFMRRGDAVHLLAGNRERSDWVANLLANPQVSIRISDITYSGLARVDPAASDDIRESLRKKYATASDDLASWSRASLPVRVESLRRTRQGQAPFSV